MANLTSQPVDVVHRELRVIALDHAAWRARRRGDHMSMDAYLDQRLELRPPHGRAPVPVVPGPTS